MTLLRICSLVLSFQIFFTFAQCYNLSYSGVALTTRYWDCCKPSCGWKGKADVSAPVESCSWDDKPIDVTAGTGCNGGSAFQCSDQQPWAVNDTFAYGFAGAFILPALTHGGIEASWCCACYQLDFTSAPLIGKTLVIQASNTAYDIITTNRFTLAVSISVRKKRISRLNFSCRYPAETSLRKMHVPSNTMSANQYSERIWRELLQEMIVRICPNR